MQKQGETILIGDELYRHVCVRVYRVHLGIISSLAVTVHCILSSVDNNTPPNRLVSLSGVKDRYSRVRKEIESICELCVLPSFAALWN